MKGWLREHEGNSSSSVHYFLYPSSWWPCRCVCLLLVLKGSVLFTYCCLTNCSKTYRLKKTRTDCLTVSVEQESRCGGAGCLWPQTLTGCNRDDPGVAVSSRSGRDTLLPTPPRRQESVPSGCALRISVSLWWLDIPTQWQLVPMEDSERVSDCVPKREATSFIQPHSGSDILSPLPYSLQ